MKTIITLSFLLFSFLGFSQTTREEVVERNKIGQKLKVNTYSGTGNNEKLIKSVIYKDMGLPIDYPFSITATPIAITYFGKFKVQTNDVELVGWGVIKSEIYGVKGELLKTWKITDDNGPGLTYTILP